MSKHDDDTCPHLVRASLLETENAHLNAEVKRLRKLESMIDPLQAEVERLRNTGDAMADEIIGCYNAEGYDPADSESLRNWNAAKEGKPSA